jgi:hypothetical protein
VKRGSVMAFARVASSFSLFRLPRYPAGRARRWHGGHGLLTSEKRRRAGAPDSSKDWPSLAELPLGLPHDVRV